MTRVLILGGDGFCGWPTAVRLQMAGADIAIVDNLSRRRIAEELGAPSLTPIASLPVRLRALEERSGRSVPWHDCDVAEDFDQLERIFREFEPDQVIHFAEQRSVPYAMASSANSRYTIRNNVGSTQNVIWACVRSPRPVHLLHLGTAGIYGYRTRPWSIPEGDMDMQIALPRGGGTASLRAPHPMTPGSVYHLSKALDHSLFRYFAEYEGLAVTDVHQGVVWGSQTELTGRSGPLLNRYDYDAVYGTVVNRFALQAVLGMPLSVYGSGRQGRGYIHLEDVTRCIELIMGDPAPPGTLVTRHQYGESHSVLETARMVSDLTGARIAHIPMQRPEEEESHFDLRNDGLRALGYQPMRMRDVLEREITQVVEEHHMRAVRSCL